MTRYLIFSPNIEVGHVFIGSYEAENEEDAVHQMKYCDLENADMAQKIAARDGTQYEVYEINDVKTVTVRNGEIKITE